MSETITQRRLRGNSNLRLLWNDTYQKMEVYNLRGPQVQNYLAPLDLTFDRAFADHPRLFVVRFDLHLSDRLFEAGEVSTDGVLQRFVNSLKAKIAHDRRRAAQENGRAHDTRVRYVWAKEYGTGGKPHYHFLLLLNRDAYHTLGNFRSTHENMGHRIVGAWASALKISPEECAGLVHFCENGTYHLNGKTDPQFAEAFYRASYLCKAQTKAYGDGGHAFGYSRY